MILDHGENFDAISDLIGDCSEEDMFNEYKLMHEGQTRTYRRAFSIKKIGLKRTSNETNDFLTCKHLESEDTARTVNQQEWSGRNFYHPSIPDDKKGDWSVPWGYEP